MAQPLKYRPEAPPTERAHEELERLVETLHESGTLRTLIGLFGRLDGVTDVALDHVMKPGGVNAVSNALILAKGLMHVDPDHLQAFQDGTEKGLGAARESLKDDPPGPLALVRQLSHHDTRRGLYAALVLLQTLGRHLHEHLDGQSEALQRSS